MNEQDHTPLELAVTVAVVVLALLGYGLSVWWAHLGWLLE